MFRQILFKTCCLSYRFNSLLIRCIYIKEALFFGVCMLLGTGTVKNRKKSKIKTHQAVFNEKKIFLSSFLKLFLPFILLAWRLQKKNSHEQCYKLMAFLRVLLRTGIGSIFLFRMQMKSYVTYYSLEMLAASIHTAARFHKESIAGNRSVAIKAVTLARRQFLSAVTYLNEGLRAKNPCNSNSSGRGVAGE